MLVLPPPCRSGIIILNAKWNNYLQWGGFMSEAIQIAIIGGGVIGCAIARELSAQYEQVFLFEKNPGITQGENQTSRNSGVIHSGIYYDQATRPLKAALCVEGNRLLYGFCDRYSVPAIKTGKLIVASNPSDEEVLDLYLARGRENQVPEVGRISGAQVRELEPNVSARSALIVPSSGIVDPVVLVYRLHTLAAGDGVQFVTDTEVLDLASAGDLIRLTIRYRDGRTDQVMTRALINAAGVEADRLTAMLRADSPYELDPVRGDSYKFYGHKRPELRLRGMNVYPTPEAVKTPHGAHFTVGVHLTPTFESVSYPPALGSTVTVGPKLIPVPDRGNAPVPPQGAGFFAQKVQSYFPGLKEEDLIWHQMGLQARLKGHPDFVITSDSFLPNVINLLGIDSPGLTSCLAVARRTKEMVERLGL
jgi:L-2-hydroxyglutarate oxidase LhgO